MKITWIAATFAAVVGAITVAACSSSPVVVTDVDAGRACGTSGTLCGDTCAALANDNANCGACGTACKAGLLCSKGACATSCGGGTTQCGATCNDTQVDANNCGACGTKCKTGEVCSSGKCASGCSMGQTTCGNSCVNAQTDNANCGACGTLCGAGQACSAGKCSTTCQMGLSLCGQQVDGGGPALCSNTKTDPNNCGSCGTVCAQGQVCTQGKCAINCQANETVCNGNSCANTTSDNDNCGSCGNVCSNGQVCSKGICTVTCTMNTTLCNGSCVDTQNDPNNCTSCGNVCGNGLVCVNGACTANCGALTQCGNVCIDTVNDPTNCGGCGKACGNGLVCNKGVCGPSCGQLTACGNSCVDLHNDPKNCSSCGTVCGNGLVCVNGACSANCGALTQCGNGCVDSKNDPKNCGSCGKVCPLNNACVASACVPLKCNLTVLYLGDGNAAANAGTVSLLKAAGFTVTSSTTDTYAGSPAASTFGVVLVLPGTTFGSDMPGAGQTSIVNAQALQTGVVFSEWAAFENTQARFTTLQPLMLFPRSNGITSTLTFTSTLAHPIWTGLPNSFVTTVAVGANVGNVLNVGATQIATCKECLSQGVAVLDKSAGRVVQIAHAAGYTGNWTTDANLNKMMSNAALWGARCL